MASSGSAQLVESQSPSDPGLWPGPPSPCDSVFGEGAAISFLVADHAASSLGKEPPSTAPFGFVFRGGASLRS